MAINYNIRAGACPTSGYGSGGCNPCPSKDGCPPDQCPDFVIRRHDTKPPFKIAVADCDGPLDIQGLVVEMSMWANAKIKTCITATDTYFGFADCIGFNQVMVGDIIVTNRVRAPEYMLVQGFDEENKLVLVERGYRGTTPTAWKKGTGIKIFRILNAPAQTEIVLEDITYPDGTTETDVLQEAYLVYEWTPEDTCLPGCYWVEFKLIKMKDLVLFLPGGIWGGPVHLEDDEFYYTGTIQTNSSVKLSYDSVNDKYRLPSDVWAGEIIAVEADYYTGDVTDDGSVLLNITDTPVDADTVIGPNEFGLTFMGLDSNISFTPSFTPSMSPDEVNQYYGCILGDGVEWSRKFPVTGEGFLIKIEGSPVREF